MKSIRNILSLAICLWAFCSGHQILALLPLAAFADSVPESQPAFDPVKAREELDAALKKSVVDKDGQVYRNAVFYIEAPNQRFIYANADGVGRADTGEEMTPDHQFHIMSITKTLTATLVLQLWEEGFFGEKGLDSTLAELEVFPEDVIDELHQIDGVSYGRNITVRHLLNHTTGVKNFTYDDADGLAADYPGLPCAPGSFFGMLILDEKRGLVALNHDSQEATPEGHEWMEYVAKGRFPEGVNTGSYYLFYPSFPHWDYDAWVKDPTDRMAGLLNFYLSGMNRTAIFVPGTDVKYTDTNYIILGLLVEKMTGNSLHHELRKRIFDPLGMAHSYMSLATDPPFSKWQDKVSDFWETPYPVVSTGIKLSVNWSDAGAISNVRDLNTFIRALAKGKLFREETTLSEMLKTPFDMAEGFGYGCGIVVKHVDDDTILFHTGGAGSWMLYYTGSDISYIGTVNESSGERPRFAEIHRAVHQALENAGLKLHRIFEQ